MRNQDLSHRLCRRIEVGEVLGETKSGERSKPGRTIVVAAGWQDPALGRMKV